MTRKAGVLVIVIGAVGFLAVVGIGVWLFIRHIVSNEVHGTVTAHSATIGNWTVTPDSCQSGERNQFRGVQLFVDGTAPPFGGAAGPGRAGTVDGDDGFGMAYLDPVGGESVITVNIPGAHKSARFGHGDCAKLEGHIRRQNSTVNRIANVEGDVAFDCGTPDDHVSGELTFSNCH